MISGDKQKKKKKKKVMPKVVRPGPHSLKKSGWATGPHGSAATALQAIPYAQCHFPPETDRSYEFVFMDDNARPHRAQVADQFLEENGIEHME